MGFLELAGGFFAFGLLWLLVPRAAFVWVLALYLYHQHGVKIFTELLDDKNIYEFFTTVLVVAGVVMGAVLDFFERQNTFNS